MSNLSKEMELRLVPSQYQHSIARLLDMDDSILHLMMGSISKNSDDLSSELRFDSADIDTLRTHAERLKKSPILMLLDEWSTMGKSRPKVKHLLSLLIKCQLFHAADYVADLINEPKPQRPQTGPSAYVDISISSEEEVTEDINKNLDNQFSKMNKNAKISHPKNIDLKGSDQSTAQANHELDQNSRGVSDLIKFSQLEIQSTNKTSSFDNIPALSIIHHDSSENAPQPSSTIDDNIPVMINNSTLIKSNSKEVLSDIPDFSGLLNNSSRSQDDSEVSYTQSSMSSIN